MEPGPPPVKVQRCNGLRATCKSSIANAGGGAAVRNPTQKRLRMR